MPIRLPLLALVGLVAAVLDRRRRRIPNVMTYTGVALGLLVGIVDNGAVGLAIGAVGVGVAAVLSIPLFLAGGMGGGDVKLLAAVGAIGGAATFLEVFVAAGVVAMVAAGFTLAWRGTLLRTLAGTMLALASRLAPRAWRRPFPDGARLRMRFGPALGLGAVAIALFQGLS